ncbi:helix-turn-helix transcriptional regulator [Nocardia uniformis]|uniref:Helix-turn-helix transcriptional regulator n=1 Tax=Nocardia uniformis TaxID=53432 RepID=A0A849C228_9NOCA|nr:helix-turn-helix transcriptional regulator [Nocardia uniformis]NNH69059.1 helix-turn-helix transcriptional regulator [Nocardia uniformis]
MSGPSFGDEVRDLRSQRGWSQRQLAKRIGARNSGALCRVEKGERNPTPELADALDVALDAGGRLIALAAATHESDIETVGPAAQRSMEFAEWASGLPTGSLGVESVIYELGRIAISYVHDKPQPLFEDLQRLRDRQWQLLRARPAAGVRRELLFTAGVTVVLLAQVTGNLGDPRAAMQQALAAKALAAKAGHPGLQSWVSGTQALIAEWGGNPVAAYDFACQASALAPAGEQLTRVAALQARCAARLGRADDARAAITRALHAGEWVGGPDEVGAFGGVLRFPTAKLAYYAGSTYRLIGDGGLAERYGLEAITSYTAGPAHEYSYGDAAIARTDVAIARVHRGEFEGAGDVLVPVLDLPVGQRISPVCVGLRAVERSLQSVQSGRASSAAQLSKEIARFTTTPTALP